MKPRREKIKRNQRKERKKNREPKKSTGSDGGLRNCEQDKHLERKRKKISMFRNNGISVLVVLVFLLQQPVLVLVFHSSSVVVSLGGWVRRGAL
jgi:ATP-dependent 26S proteasome regulatory subunit